MKKGSVVTRKSKHYVGIIGDVKDIKGDKVLVHWRKSTGTRAKKKLLNWIKISSLKIVV